MIERFHEVSKELIHTTRELHHATELQEVAEEAGVAGHEANTVAIEAETVAQEELAVAETGGIGIMVAVVAALAACGVAIYEYIKGKEEQEIAEDLANQAMDGTVIKSKELREAYDQTLLSIRNTNNEMLVMNGLMTEQAAKIDEIKQKTKSAVREIQNEMQSKLNEAEPGLLSRLFFGDIANAKAAKEKLEIFKEYTSKAAAEQLKEQNEIMRTALDDIQRMDNGGKIAKYAKLTLEKINGNNM